MQTNEYYLRIRVWTAPQPHCCLWKALWIYSWSTELSGEGKKDNHTKCILKVKGSTVGPGESAHREQEASVLSSWAASQCQTYCCTSEPLILAFLEITVHLIFVNSCFLLSYSFDRHLSYCPSYFSPLHEALCRVTTWLKPHSFLLSVLGGPGEHLGRIVVGSWWDI